MSVTFSPGQDAFLYSLPAQNAQQESDPKDTEPKQYEGPSLIAQGDYK